VKNSYFCSDCNRIHKKVDSKRPSCLGQYCAECHDYHEVKTNDFWCETSMIGLKVNYYAYLDDAVYDVTDWVTCRKEEFDFVQPNSHDIMCKLWRKDAKNSNQRSELVFDKVGMQVRDDKLSGETIIECQNGSPTAQTVSADQAKEKKKMKKFS